MGSSTSQGSRSGGRPAISGAERVFSHKAPVLKPQLLKDLRPLMASGVLALGVRATPTNNTKDAELP